MEKLGLADIRVDDMFNVSGVRKGSGGGPTVVFAAHMDTVFPEGTDVTVKREGDVLRAPRVGDDTSNLIAVLEMFRARDQGGVKTKGVCRTHVRSGPWPRQCERSGRCASQCATHQGRR